MTADIQWFPGHMKKALRLISEQLDLVDMVIETCDARIPLASRNNDLNSVLRQKPRLLVLNKADLADDTVTNEWLDWYRQENLVGVACNAGQKKGLEAVRREATRMCADMLQRAHNKGRMGRSVRAMVVGIPNSGKSTLINALCNRKIAVTGDRPGVTRGFQWARSDSGLELMDMPGILPPKLGNRHSQLCLALTGAVKLEVVDSVTVAVEGLALLRKLYPALLLERYKIQEEAFFDEANTEYDLFLMAAKSRGCLLSGGRIDEERFANLFLDDYRSGRIGAISLERPEILTRHKKETKSDS